MRTHLALLCSVVAVASILGVVPLAEGTPVGQSFTLEVGTNTISGFFFTYCSEPGPACFVERLEPAQFDVIIPAHTQLVGITTSFPGDTKMGFTLSGAANGIVFYDPFVGLDWDLGGSFCPEILCIEVDLPAGPGSIHVENLPFAWRPHTPFYEGPFGGDFQLAFTVAGVPEPSATLFLLGTGLAGLGGMAWRRHRTS